VNIEEVKYYLSTLSDDEKRQIISDESKNLSVKITNLVLDEHPVFGMTLSLAGISGGDKAAFEVWKTYWKETDTPEYAHPTWYGFFIIELEVRTKAHQELKEDLNGL